MYRKLIEIGILVNKNILLDYVNDIYIYKFNYIIDVFYVLSMIIN
jgi:hypothetical protein